MRQWASKRKIPIMTGLMFLPFATFMYLQWVINQFVWNNILPGSVDMWIYIVLILETFSIGVGIFYFLDTWGDKNSAVIFNGIAAIALTLIVPLGLLVFRLLSYYLHDIGLGNAAVIIPGICAISFMCGLLLMWREAIIK